MKKIINTAPMAVITTLHTPLTVSLTLKPVGEDATITQAQDVLKSLWLPDRTINPLFLVPVFDVYNPDIKEKVQATPALSWYVDGVTVTTQSPNADYYIVSDAQATDEVPAGSLAVRKNTSYMSPVTIKCLATYQSYADDDEVVLTSENKPDSFYRVDIKTPPIVEYRPLKDDSTQKTFQTFVQHGQEALVWNEVIGKSINAIDLSTLTWTLSGGIFSATLSSAAKTTGGCALSGYTQNQSLVSDKTISTSNGNIRVKDAAYNTTDAFKEAMFGKVLFYELATKTVQEDFVTAMSKMTGFFWYLDGEVITKDTFGYVSGQGMETLTLDADYIDDSIISVRLAVPMFTEGEDDTIVTMPTLPSGNTKAQSTLLWAWDDVDVMPIALGGSSIHQYASQKVFNSVARMNGKDLDSSKRLHLRAVWFTHDTEDRHSTKEYYGDAASVTLPSSALFRTGKVNVEVGLDLYLLGHQHPTVDGDTGQYIKDEQTGEIVFTRNQTQIVNKAPLAIIHSSNSPLTVSLTLKPVGDDATLTQAQDVTKNLWIPDRTINSLVLEPVLSAYDPDAKQNVTINPVYTWFVNGVQVPASNTASADYYIIPSGSELPQGSLVVRKNTSYASPDIIRCVATYADSLHINALTQEAEVTLTTENKPEAVYTVDIMSTQPIIFRPLTDATSQISLEAFAQYGETRLHEEVKYFWYVDDVLITDDFVGYISGQGTETLVVDLDCFKDVVISVCLGVPVSGVMPSSPNLNAKAQRLVIWDYEDAAIIPIGRGSNAVRISSGSKFFEGVLQVNGKDVSDERRQKYTRTKWFTHDTDADQDDIVDKGWSPSLELTKADMYRNTNVNVEVGVDLYVLDKFSAVVDSESGAVVIDEATNRVVVMNN